MTIYSLTITLSRSIQFWYAHFLLFWFGLMWGVQIEFHKGLLVISLSTTTYYMDEWIIFATSMGQIHLGDSMSQMESQNASISSPSHSHIFVFCSSFFSQVFSATLVCNPRIFQSIHDRNMEEFLCWKSGSIWRPTIGEKKENGHRTSHGLWQKKVFEL
jgi:hypothetical protein